MPRNAPTQQKTDTLRCTEWGSVANGQKGVIDNHVYEEIKDMLETPDVSSIARCYNVMFCVELAQSRAFDAATIEAKRPRLCTNQHSTDTFYFISIANVRKHNHL